MNEDIIKEIDNLSKKPKLFDKDGGNIWTEPYIAKQMLNAHLNSNFDAASRNFQLIDKTIDFLNKIIKPKSTILDLGCGPGLYAERLCRNGHKVTGIDFSENTIRYAANSAREKNLDIEYKCDNMFNIKYNEKYDVVIQIYGEINTFSYKERDELFDKVRNSLKPEGLFIFDVSTPVSRKKNKLKKNWYVSNCDFWREDRHIVLEDGFEYDDDIWLDQYIVIDDENVTVYRNWFHDYTMESIKKVVLNSGFSNLKLIGSLTGEEIIDNEEWITVIARK